MTQHPRRSVRRRLRTFMLLAAATAVSACTEFPEQLSQTEFDRLVLLQPGSCTTSCGGRFPATTFQPEAGWDLTKARPTGGALVLDDGGEATLSGPTFEGEGRLELVLDVDATEGTLLVGFEVGGLAGERGAWGAFDVATAEARGVHASVQTTETTAALSWTAGEPITVEVNVDCGGLHLRVGEEEIVLDTRARFEADRVFVRWSGKGQVSVSAMAMESACTAFDATCAQACSGGGACEVAVCTALGVCSVVAASESVACEDGDDCTIEDRCLTTGCAGTVNDCDDDDPCTTDRCDKNDGACVSAPIPGCVPPADGWLAARRVYPLVAGAPETESTIGDRDDVLLEVPLATLAVDRLVVLLPLDDNFEGILPGDVAVQDFGSVYVAGRHGKALEPTSASRIELKSPQGSFSLMAWVRPNEQTLTNTAAFGFFPPPGEGSQVTLRLRNGDWVFEAGGDPIVLGPATGQWQHVAVSWDDASASGLAMLDGEVSRRFDAVDLPANALLLLGDPAMSGTFRVWLDELAYFERAVSPSEVRALNIHGVPLGAPPFGDVRLQADFDDLRVRAGETVVPHDLIGRRPHGDSGLPAANVLRSWRFDGDLMPSIGEAEFRGDGVRFESGVFGDAGGALAPPDGVELWTDRSEAISPPFSVEVWVQLTAATDDCGDTFDGASIVEALSENAADRGGIILRACDGAPQLALVAGSAPTYLDSDVDLEDDSWHHLVASVGTEETTFYVDGLARAARPTPAKASLPAVPFSVLRRQHGASPTPTEGRVDELLIHRVALDAGAVLARFTPLVPAVRILTDVRRDGADYSPLTLELGREDWSWKAPALGCSSVDGACQGVVGHWVPSDWALPLGGLSAVADRTGSGALMTFAARDGLTGLAEGRLGTPLDRGTIDGANLLPDAWTVEVVVVLDALTDGRLLTLLGDDGELIWSLEIAGERLRVRTEDATSTLDDVVLNVGLPLVVGATYDGANLSAFAGDTSADPVTAVYPVSSQPALQIGPVGPPEAAEPPIAGSLFELRVSDYVRPAPSRLGARMVVRLD